MAVQVTRTITLTYPDFETYFEDRQHWNLSEEGSGYFGSFKHWQHEVTLEEVPGAMVSEEFGIV